MVSFGTKGGPIIPPPVTTTTELPRDKWREPAPVYEHQDDIPNPNAYKPISPQEYKKQIYKNKPSPNLILGTPLDRKYATDRLKYTPEKEAKPYGLDYRGPQTFAVQEYEKDERRLGNGVGQTADRRHGEQDYGKYVPGIGVLYSSGLRYYVPQILYYGFDDVDNSVYEANDLKYYYNNKNYRHY